MDENNESNVEERCYSDDVDKKILPDLLIFSSDIDGKTTSQKINNEINLLCEHVYILNVKSYKNIWKKFIIDVGTWIGRNNLSLLQETIYLLSINENLQITKIWLLNGLISSSKSIADDSKDIIYELVRNNIVFEYTKPKINTTESEYVYLLKSVSLFLNKCAVTKWREWIYKDLCNFRDIQKLDNYQKFIIDMSIYYINDAGDETLRNEVTENITRLISSIICCDSKFTLKNILRTCCYNQTIIDSVSRLLKRTTNPLNVLDLLEFCVKEIDKDCNTSHKFDPFSNEIISALIYHVSNSVLAMISSNSEQNRDNVNVVKTSLNICYYLVSDNFEGNQLFSWLDETISSFNVTKTSVQMKISMLLFINTIFMRLINLKMTKHLKKKLNNGNDESICKCGPFVEKISKKSQEFLLLTMEMKLPIASPQYYDHFKLLSVHTSSLFLVLIHNSNSNNYFDEYSKKILFLLKDSSISETSRLTIVSSFVNAIHLINVINYTTSSNRLVDVNFQKSVKNVLFSSNISNLLVSALNRTNNLKKASVMILGQILMIKDMLEEHDIFDRLNVTSSMNNSFLYPKLSTLLSGTFSFFSNNYCNSEINVFVVILEIISNSKYKGLNNDDYFPTLSLNSCMQLFKEICVTKPVGNYISLLIQMGRISSFSSLNDDFNLKLVQYSGTNIEIFQGVTLISGLKRPIPGFEDMNIENGGIKSMEICFKSLIDCMKSSSIFKDETVLGNLVVSFAVILGSFYSTKISDITKKGFCENETISNFISLPNTAILKVWFLLLTIIENYGELSQKMKCSYLTLFLLCSYHPLLIQKKESEFTTQEGIETCNKSYHKKSKHDIKYEASVNKLSSMFDLQDILNTYDFRKNLVNLFLDSTYLPLSDTTGFRRACLNMLRNRHIIENSEFLRELTDKLTDDYYDCLELLTSDMPFELGDFVVSNQNNLFEFSISDNNNIVDNANFAQDIQEHVYNKVRSFMDSGKRFNEFSDVYELVKNSEWLGRIILNSSDDSVYGSMGNNTTGNSNKTHSSVATDQSKKDATFYSSTKSASVANMNTSAFAIAKLRKAQMENKSKSGKQQSSIGNKNVNSSLTTGSDASVGGSSGGNMTKKEIIDQQIRRQKEIRDDLNRVVSKIKCVLEMFLEISRNALFHSSQLSLLTVRTQTMQNLQVKLSDIVHSVCDRMIEFRPLRKYGLKFLEFVFNASAIESNVRFSKTFLKYLSFISETENNNSYGNSKSIGIKNFERRSLLNTLVESFTADNNREIWNLETNNRIPSFSTTKVGNPAYISALVCIVSKALYNLCEHNEEDKSECSKKESLLHVSINEEIKMLSKLILYISFCIRNFEGFAFQVNQVCNLLYLYVFLLGDLVKLDQYVNPIKHLLAEIKMVNAEELELVSSLLIFPYISLRILVLELINREVDKNDVNLSYYSYVNIRISNETSIFMEEKISEVDRNKIASLSLRLLNKYNNKEDINKAKERLINDLLVILESPITTLNQKKNIYKVVLSECEADDANTSHVISILLGRLKSIKDDWLNIENEYLDSCSLQSLLLYKDNWPKFLCKALVRKMTPKTVSYLNSIIPNESDNLNSNEKRMFLRIQKRNSIMGLFLCLNGLIGTVNESFYKLAESCIKFVLIDLLDSTLLKDGDSNDFNSIQDKTGVKNMTINSEIMKYETESLREFEETLTDFFVSLTKNGNINISASKILETLQNLSVTCKPKVNSNEFHNTLAFSIGCIASCCKVNDTVVNKITYNIVNELLSGKLCKKTQEDLPILTDVPNEYTKILPKLFEMFCLNKQENDNDFIFDTPIIDDLQLIYSEYGFSENMDDGESFDIERIMLKENEHISKHNETSVSFESMILKVSLVTAIFSNEAVSKIGSAHVFGSMSKAIGVKRLNRCMVLKLINNLFLEYSENSSTRGKTQLAKLEGLLDCIGSLSLYLGELMEPYMIIYLNKIIKIISENDQRIRYYSEKTTEILVKNLSKYGIKQVLPMIIEGIEEKQWRIKIAILRLLVILSKNSPSHFSFFLPKAIEIINKATSDSHQNVSKTAKETLCDIIELVRNPEVREKSEDFIRTLIDPTENNIRCSLSVLKSITFVHAVDTTTLSLILPVLLKPIQERGQTELKKDSLKILSSLLSLLSQKSDIDPFLIQIENSIHIALTDPIPEIRILTARLCKSLVSVAGQEKLSSLISWLFKTLSMEVGQTLKSGLSASLAEVLSVLGIEKFKKILPYILDQISSLEIKKNIDDVSDNNASMSSSILCKKEGYIGLFVYLPQTFGEELGCLMPDILPRLLCCLGDEHDSIREAALNACKSLVVHFGSGHAGYIIQPLEDGLVNNNWRVRLSCCTLLGLLLNGLIKDQLGSTGMSLCNDPKVIGEAGFLMQRRSYILAAIYMARSDENTSVKNTASTLWKSLVQNTPQTLKDILPILIRRIINSLSSSRNQSLTITMKKDEENGKCNEKEEGDVKNNPQIGGNNVHYIAVQCLKDLLEKFGNSLQGLLLPILYQNMGGVLEGVDIDMNMKETHIDVCAIPNVSARIGACIGLLEFIKAIKKNELKNSINSFVPLIKMGLCDTDLEVRSVSVDCLDIISTESPDLLFRIIDWLLDDVLIGKNGVKDDSRISAIELIIQLPHNGIVAKIFPKVSSGNMDLKKTRIIKAFSRIPSQNKLRSCLFEVVPLLLDTYSGENTTLLEMKQEECEFVDKHVSDSAYNAMSSIVQSLDEHGIETYVTILLDILKNNTPSENLTVSGRYQINNNSRGDQVQNLLQLEETKSLEIRVKSLEFLRLSFYTNSPIYEICYNVLIKYLLPIAICDISEEARISAIKTFQIFVNTIPRKLIIKSSSVMREVIGTLIYDPMDHQKCFEKEENKLIGNVTWFLDKGKVCQRRIILRDEVRGGNSEEDTFGVLGGNDRVKRLERDLVDSNNKLLDSITSLYIQGMTLGTTDSREECAAGLYEVIHISFKESIKPITVKLVGPLIRLISEKTTTSIVRASLLNNLSLLIKICDLQLRPLLPQIQTILIKYVVDQNENIRESCSNGIGCLYKLLGNRSDTLLSDLCSLVARQSSSSSSNSLDVIYSILNSIYLAIKPNSVDADGIVNSDTNSGVSSFYRNKGGEEDKPTALASTVRDQKGEGDYKHKGKGELKNRSAGVEISVSLRNKLIGMVFNFVENGVGVGDGNGSCSDTIVLVSLKILSYLLVEHCNTDEIKDILLPLISVSFNHGDGDSISAKDLDSNMERIKNLLCILNLSFDIENGWEKMCLALKDEDTDSGSWRSGIDSCFEFKGCVGSGEDVGERGVKSQRIYIYSEGDSESTDNLVKLSIKVPFESQTNSNALSWLYYTLVNSILKTLFFSSNFELKKLNLEVFYNITRYLSDFSGCNHNESNGCFSESSEIFDFSISIIIQVLSNILLNSKILFNKVLSNCSDNQSVLKIQKVCELLVNSCLLFDSEGERSTAFNSIDSEVDGCCPKDESHSCTLLSKFTREIENNFKYYSFCDASESGSGSSCHLSELDQKTIFISLVSVTSVQTINSKHPIFKLKSEQILITVTRYLYHQMYVLGNCITGFNSFKAPCVSSGKNDCKDRDLQDDNDIKQERDVNILCGIAGNINKMTTPDKQIPDDLYNYFLEYSKRVLVRKIRNC